MFRNPGRPMWAMFALALLFVSSAFAIRAGHISRTLNPESVEARRYFAGADFKYGGGVVPRGRVKYQHEGKDIDADEVELVIQQRKVGVTWNGDFYVLPIEDKLLCPLAKFIDRGSYIAYTVPMVGIDEGYFRDHRLFKWGGGYVAEEFRGTGLESFLRAIDLSARTEPIPELLEAAIVNNVHSGRAAVERTQEGSLVNADFHVTYIAHLVDGTDGKHVDIEGLPLCYAWDIAAGGTAVIAGVRTFVFPTKEGLQYRAVLFFQHAALLRQSSVDDANAWAEFLKAACDLGED